MYYVYRHTDISEITCDQEGLFKLSAKVSKPNLSFPELTLLSYILPYSQLPTCSELSSARSTPLSSSCLQSDFSVLAVSMVVPSSSMLPWREKKNKSVEKKKCQQRDKCTDPLTVSRSSQHTPPLEKNKPLQILRHQMRQASTHHPLIRLNRDIDPVLCDYFTPQSDT